MRFVVALSAAFSLLASHAGATVLTFENFSDGAVIVDSYGDLIDTTLVRGFPYRIEAEGTTPNVFVGFEDSLRVENGSFTAANGVATDGGDGQFGFGFTGRQTATIVDVRLHDFVLYARQGVLENIVVEVYDHTCNEIFRGIYTVTEAGTKVTFQQGMNMFLTGRVLDVSVRGLDGFPPNALGIDDIRFSQVSTPLPAAALFMGTGLALATWRRRHKRA